jgi:hypothetical protein
MIGIREDRVSKKPLTYYKTALLAAEVGYESIECIATKPLRKRWHTHMKYSGIYSLPVESMCLDYWLSSNRLEDVSHTITSVCQSHISNIILPCFEESAIDSKEKLAYLKKMLSGIPIDFRKNILLESDISLTTMIELCTKYGIKICYDLGNERTIYREETNIIPRLTQHIGEIHLKWREFGSSKTIHLPDDEEKLNWLRERIQLIYKCGFSGNVILETPASKTRLKSNLKKARYCCETT